MSPALHTGERQRSLGEERANSISHGLALLAVLAGSPYLLAQALRQGDAWFAVGASVFAGSMAFLYAASSFYHALPGGRRKAIFHKIEHAAIFFLIAGSYTPFGLGILRGEGGWTVLGVIWGLAIAGIGLKTFSRGTHPAVFVVLYLLMGWLLAIAFGPLLGLLSSAGLGWLLAGGIAYTTGLLFFAADLRIRYAHFIWHLFVIAGTTCHYFAVLWHAAPA